jgi:crotonobetainyl-CoA:carnitine CoA-transferase CaiB-like acyl-CoA transferase
VIDRLGFGYQAVSAKEPRILYVSISGFGLSGPLSERPAMDPVLQAYTGLMAENRGEDGIPHRIPIISIDMSTAIYAFTAVSAALYARRDEPLGRHIEASLMQGGASLQVVRMMGSYLDGGAPRPIIAPSGIYQTQDGWLSITVVRPFEWDAFCKAIGRPDLGEDARYKTNTDREPHTPDLNAILRPLLLSRPTAAWSASLTEHRVMHEALNSYTEFLKQPHVTESGAVAWTSHPHMEKPIPLPNLIGLPPFQDGAARSVSPSKGEHSAAILREHGYTIEDIAGFVARGIVLQAG